MDRGGWGVCSLLPEASLIVALGLKVLSRLYSFALFLRTSGYFLRLVLAVPLFLDDNRCRIKFAHISGPPCPEAVVWQQEALAFVAGHHFRSLRADSKNIQHHWLGCPPQRETRKHSSPTTAAIPELGQPLSVWTVFV